MREYFDFFKGKLRAHPNILQTSLLLSLIIVWLPLTGLSCPAPEGELAGDGGGGNPLVPVSPEPTVHVDRLQFCGVATLVENLKIFQNMKIYHLVQKIALSTASPHGRDVI